MSQIIRLNSTLNVGNKFDKIQELVSNFEFGLVLIFNMKGNCEALWFRQLILMFVILKGNLYWQFTSDSISSDKINYLWFGKNKELYMKQLLALIYITYNKSQFLDPHMFYMLGVIFFSIGAL